jgi:predicted nucleotidyltransferase
MPSEEEIRRSIVSIIRRHLPSPRLKIYLFGSRATGAAAPSSDYDIALDMGAPIDWAALGKIRCDLSDSMIPVRVDVVDLTACSPAFSSLTLREAQAW